MGYTTEFDAEKMSRALGKELPISPKKSEEVCKALKGMHIDDARRYLEDVLEKKRAIPFKRHKRFIGHKKGIGPGGYPFKVIHEIMKILDSAQSNAEAAGLDSENMKIHTISASRGQPDKFFRPRARGRTSPWVHETTNVEVVLEVVEEE